MMYICYLFMASLYPLIFEPLFIYRIWGGTKLRDVLSKNFEGDCIGESWEISDVKDNKTIVAQGALKGKTLTELIEMYGASLLGSDIIARFGNEFPLLIKCIDAKTPLSIQVHPNNDVAQKRHNSKGKNEMWYIMQADTNAEITIGFKKNTDIATFNNHLSKGAIEDLLHTEKVSSGDIFYIPAGRVHAIGSGVLLAEIQQTSDITYRIYDYDRIDTKTGKKRELHNDLAASVIDYTAKDDYKTSYTLEQNDCAEVIDTPYFKTNILSVNGVLKLDYKTTNSFVVLMCVGGQADVIYGNQAYTILRGSSILLPAEINSVILEGNRARLLEVTV